jgi:hypothetical protein
MISSLHIIERLYIMILILDSEIGANVFSIFYLGFAGFLWLKGLSLSISMNKFAVYVVV